MADDQPLTDLERTLPPHLGGHFGNTNIDTATLDDLVRRYGVRSRCWMSAVGRAACSRRRGPGLEAYGIDGDPHLARACIWVHDYTTGPLASRRMGSGLVCRVRRARRGAVPRNYLATFAGGRVLFLTAAPPGFPGHHHVNCQEPDWYCLGSTGWALDTEATQWVRANGGHPFSTRAGAGVREVVITTIATHNYLARLDEIGTLDLLATNAGEARVALGLVGCDWARQPARSRPILCRARCSSAAWATQATAAFSMATGCPTCRPMTTR
jgi:hypothetical protein